MTFPLLFLSKIMKKNLVVEKKMNSQAEVSEHCCLSIYNHNCKREYQEAPKWIIWVSYIFLLIPFIQQQVYLLWTLRAKAMAPLLSCPWHKLPKLLRWQPYFIIQWESSCGPWQKYAPLGTRTSHPVDSRVTGIESTIHSVDFWEWCNCHSKQLLKLL